jgi:biopolymer transport protein ExbB/TolQ
MREISLLQMMMHGWAMLSVLLIASIMVWTVIIDRVRALRRARTDARAYVRDLIALRRSHGTPTALRHCQRSTRPVAVVCARLLQKIGLRDDLERALENALQGEIRTLQSGVPILGTVGSTAPFVGLLGTVIGIVKAFRDIAVNVGGGPEVVSAGIAEALITTAAGLVVAIPAVIAYNYFVHQVHRLSEEIDLAAYELIEELSGTPEEQP